MAMRIPDYPAVETTAVSDDHFVKKGVVTGEKYYRCGVCGFNYPASEFTYFEGKRYCIPHKCYEDINSIIEQRIATRVPREEEPKEGR